MPRKLEKFSVVIDSNEYHHGNTWVFDGVTTHVQSLLKYGCDYSIRGQTGIVGVERKSYSDYVRCVGAGWKQFLKQLKKLRTNRYYCVIVEGNIDDPIPTQSSMHHEAVSFRTAQLALRRIPVIFASTRARASYMCLQFLSESLKRIQGNP